ncbi:MAG TPA: sigma-54 dependent transcriptional regulator [Cellvibrionaceae bacterium]
MSLAVAQISSGQTPTIMIVEDDPALREALLDTLVLADYPVIVADSAEQALLMLKTEQTIRLIVSDVNMGELSGYDLLRQVKSDYPHIPMLLITAYASIEDSVTAIKEGAVDYLVKPFEPQLFIETVARHMGTPGITTDQPVAEAESSKQLLHLAQRVAHSESTVLIMGESGTGKEVLARYIHDHSPRRDRVFVAINCAAIPENMLEAMLFGHEKGAYTGAHSSAPGKFEQAEGGTLLLDELSEMDIGLQAKLLRVLQEREVERLGGRKTIKLDVRVIATSNRDLRAEVMAGRFREDLYYRLSVLPLEWAPLRDRPEDIIPLGEKLLARHARKQNRRHVVLDASAKRALLNYRWPGNVRELDNIMQRALILQQGRSISEMDLGLVMSNSYSEKPSLLDDLAQRPSASSVSDFFTEAPCNDAGVIATAAPLGNDLKQREFEIIMQTLDEVAGSRKKTAERLGISARTLRYKIARLKDAGFIID